MARKNAIDWSIHGDEIVELYQSGLSVREIIPLVREKHGIEYPSGTLTNFLGRRGVLRTKAEAHRLAVSKQVRLCELCGKEHTPRNYNQRWCDECTGGGKYTKRVRIHGLPAAVYESLLAQQQHRCGICGKEFESCLNTKRKKTLYVDHDHETGQVRGLLCPRCNSALSYVEDSAWLSKAQRYLALAALEPNKVRVKPPRMRRYVRNCPIAA